MKFKKGDKVQVITSRHGSVLTPSRSVPQLGLRGIIVENYNHNLGIIVKFDDHKNAYSPSDLKHCNSEIIRQRLGVV